MMKVFENNSTDSSDSEEEEGSGRFNDNYGANKVPWRNDQLGLFRNTSHHH